MKTFTICFDISNTIFNGYQAGRFSEDLSKNLNDALQKAGIGKCILSRSTMNDVILEVKANTYQEAIEVIESRIQQPEWFPNMICDKNHSKTVIPATT